MIVRNDPILQFPRSTCCIFIFIPHNTIRLLFIRAKNVPYCDMMKSSVRNNIYGRKETYIICIASDPSGRKR